MTEIYGAGARALSLEEIEQVGGGLIAAGNMFWRIAVEFGYEVIGGGIAGWASQNPSTLGYGGIDASSYDAVNGSDRMSDGFIKLDGVAGGF